MMRHPNLRAAYGPYILPDGRIEDLSGNGLHLSMIGGATAGRSGGGLLLTGGSAGVIIPAPHPLVPLSSHGLTIMADVEIPAGAGYKKAVHLAGPGYYDAALWGNGADFQAGINEPPGLFTILATAAGGGSGRAWRVLRSDPSTHSVLAISNRTRATASALVNRDAGTHVTIALGYARSTNGTDWADAESTAVVFHQVYIFDCLLSEGDMERVRMGLAPIAAEPQGTYGYDGGYGAPPAWQYVEIDQTTAHTPDMSGVWGPVTEPWGDGRLGYQCAEHPGAVIYQNPAGTWTAIDHGAGGWTGVPAGATNYDPTGVWTNPSGATGTVTVKGHTPL